MKNTAFTVQAGEIFTNAASRACLQPAVSVVISLYNYSAYIAGCLDSVRASQTEGMPGGFEVVVVDDGSTDSSVKVVEEYMAAHPLPICLVKKSANSGLADARNIGLQTARAPLIFILDADNEIRPECLMAHYSVMADSDYALAYGTINQFEHGTRKSLAVMSHREWDVREMVSHSFIDAMAMVRKETVLKLGGYSPEYGNVLPQGWEDYDLWLKLAQAGHGGKWIPQVLSDYRVHPQSMLRSILPRQRELAAYFARKFHLLVAMHGDSPTLFGISRHDLAIANSQQDWLQFQSHAESKASKFIHQLLGKKICRSICKRLAAAYVYLNP